MALPFSHCATEGCYGEAGRGQLLRLSLSPWCYTLRQFIRGSVPFIRAIGRWTMTALVINCIIGSGIFGLPSELTHMLGRASPIVMIVAAFIMAIIMMCVAEVASQFSEPGGSYLYVRTAFGRFAGMQIGWFQLLGATGGGAANAGLFMIYLTGILPWGAYGWRRVLLLTIVVATPTVANYIGVRSGARLTTLLTVAKLLPLGLLIILGVMRFAGQFEIIRTSEIVNPGLKPWLTALLLLVFTYGGYEHALIPTGEVTNPRRTVPFALFAGLLVCAIVYTLVQFVCVVTIGVGSTGRPLAETASVLIGRGGDLFVTIAVMVSTYGWLSGGILNVPRLASSLASQGDCPMFLGRLHPRFNTPAIAIVLYAALVWLMAATGTYLWTVALGAGAKIVVYSGACAALIRLRRLRPQADALRIPFGTVFAVIAIIVLVTVLTQLHSRQALLMGITALIATANWWWAKRRELRTRRASQAVIAASASN